MKNRLNSFTYLLPIVELLLAAMIVHLPTLLFFAHLKQMSHGSRTVSLESGDFVVTIGSDRFLAVAFDRTGWWAEKPVTILNTPAKFVRTFVSLVVAGKGYWWPPSSLQSTWHVLDLSDLRITSLDLSRIGH